MSRDSNQPLVVRDIAILTSDSRQQYREKTARNQVALDGVGIERHGGSVVAASEGLGKGSEFTVRLPLIAR